MPDSPELSSRRKQINPDEQANQSGDSCEHGLTFDRLVNVSQNLAETAHADIKGTG
jgi:hypothetical protein